jgi:hypothetical protein
MRMHQPDQAVFRSVLPEDVAWKPFPAFPPSARLAIVVGEPLNRVPTSLGSRWPQASS